MTCYYDYFEYYKIELPYIISGWLDTRGNFYEIEWGCHTTLAYDLVRKNNWIDDSRKYDCMRDYLIKEKKFILLDNPTGNNKTQVIQYNPLCKHTKSQINKLLELFSYSDVMIKYIVESFITNE